MKTKRESWSSKNVMAYFRLKDILLLKQKDVSDFVCLFPNSSKTTKPDELKFWGMIPLGMQKVLGYSGFVEPLAGKQKKGAL